MTPKITTAAEIQKWANDNDMSVRCDVYKYNMCWTAYGRWNSEQQAYEIFEIGRTAQAAIRKAEREIKRRTR